MAGNGKKLARQNTRIGLGQHCFIIAEAGVNHNGDYHLARQLIDVAHEAGVDAVKFQAFRTDDLVTQHAGKAEYQNTPNNPSESQYQMIKRLELSDDQFGRLAQYARKKDIQFLLSPFDRHSVDLVEKLQLPIYKIPSGEITNHPLLQYIGSKRRKVILSTGMATLGEIEEALTVLRTAGVSSIVLLHCVTSYPADIKEINLKTMATLHNAFSLPVGFSDHTLGISAAIAAVALGAAVIEKHFTLDKTLPGPDHKASLDPAELTEMVHEIRNIEKALGDGQKRPGKIEQEIKNVARKSIVTSVDIPANTKISMKMLSIKRPGNGISPKYIPRIIGRKARNPIPKDSVLSWEMLV